MFSSWTAEQIREAVVSGKVSATEVCRDFLDRITTYDDSLNAFNVVTTDQALAQAAQIDDSRNTKSTGTSLLGVPIAIKDNICTEGVETTASSHILKGFIPPYNATVVSKLEKEGAILIGKTNCDEFAMGSSNEYSALGPTRNPWDQERIPGGSSGGSAVAVAAHMSPVALGSDTGGSIRFPASMCGVVGLKPTYGRVSRYGLIAFASSLDQVGPFARTVKDTALILRALSGPDPNDSTSANEPVPDFSAALTGDIRNARIGIPRSILAEGVDEDVTARFNDALEVMEGRGAKLIDIDLPNAPHVVPTYYLIATAEASSNLARYDGVGYGYRAPLNSEDALTAMYDRTRNLGFGAEVKRRIMLGTYVLSAGYYDAYYLKAQQVRTLIQRDYERALEHVNAIAMPTSPIPAFKVGEKTNDPMQMYLVDIFTVSVNLAGLPALSLPCGFTRDRLPVGFQLIGNRFDEATLLKLSDAYEKDTNWGNTAPPSLT